MAKEVMTADRERWIYFLLNRAYPRKQNGTRGIGNQEFFAELCDQPDNVLEVLYNSAKKEQEYRKRVVGARL